MEIEDNDILTLLTKNKATITTGIVLIEGFYRFQATCQLFPYKEKITITLNITFINLNKVH